MGETVHRSERLKGARFGQHEIVRLIGHGATASVFEAIHVGLRKPVAIKLLHEHLAHDSQVAGRFVREGRVAAKLSHPNAIAVIDVGVEEGLPYLVMELLQGTDLRALLLDTASLSLEHALAFLLPIASALQHAHDAGVLHRDIKPANMFLARDARDDVVPKLLDFGLSKVLADETDGALTQTELVAGTVLYMAPEQTLGMKHSSAASDQYSFAAVLYESITGIPPFAPDGSIYALLERVRTAIPSAPSAVRPELPAALDAVILRALDRTPQARYGSVRDLARALLPFASKSTRRTLDRDFSGAPKSGPSFGADPALPRVLPKKPGPPAETQLEVAVPASAMSLRAVAALPCPAGSSPFHIKGVFYKGFVKHLEASIGLDALCAKLTDASLCAFVRQPFLASGRYDVLPFAPLFQALAQHLGMGTADLVRATTAAQVRYDAAHAYKLILATKRPEDMADRVARFNTQIYDFGSFHGRVLKANLVEIEFGNIPAFLQPWFGPMHVAYAEESLRMAGATDVIVLSHLVTDGGTQNGFPLLSFRTQIQWSEARSKDTAT